MSLIQDYQDSNDRRQDINVPKINVSLPSTEGLKPADVTEVTGAVQPAPSPSPIVPPPQEAIATAPSPVETPQTETPVETPQDPTAPPVATRELTEEQQQYEQFMNETLAVDRSSIVKPEHDLDAVKYDLEGNIVKRTPDIDAANEATQTQLMMEGKAVQSSIEDAYNMGEFQPTLYGGDSKPYIDEMVGRGRQTREALGGNLLQEQQELVEQQFQPKPLPQTETDPTKPRPDTTASFNRQWQSFFNNGLTPREFKYGRGIFGEAGSGIVGGLIYHLGLPQNLAFGMGLDIENAVQRSPLGGLYNKAGDVARGGLQAGLNAIGAFGNFVNSKIGMGQVNTQLPKNFDPVRADPNFKGSYTINALRGEQYNFSDPFNNDKSNPMGIVLPGNNPTFMIGLGGDVLGDPAGAALALLKPLRQGNRVVRTAGRAAEIAVDPIGEAVFPALGTVTTSIFRNPKPALPPASTVPSGKPPKKGAKKKASQAGVVPPTNKKPQTINVPPTVEPAPPKGSPLRAAWEQRQAARKARAEAAKVKRVIIPAPPKSAVVNPDGGVRRVIVTPEPPTPLTVTLPGGKPALRKIPTPTAATIAITDQAGKVQLQPLTPGILMREASEEIAERPVPKIPGRKRADLEAEVVTPSALPEGTPRPALPGVTDDVVEAERLTGLVNDGEKKAATDEVARLEDISQNGTLVTPPKEPKGILPPAKATNDLDELKRSSRNTNQTDEIENGVLVTPPPSAAKELLDAEVVSRQLLDVGDGQVVEGVEAAKVAAQTLRRNEAELVRVANRQAIAETLAPAVKKVNAPSPSAGVEYLKKPEYALINPRRIVTQVDVAPDEALVKQILEEGGLTEPIKLREIGVGKYELADESQAVVLASVRRAKELDPRGAEMTNSFLYRPKGGYAALPKTTVEEIADDVDAVLTPEAAVVQARQVVESIPVDVQPSIIPTVRESVFKGEMTVSEVAEQIANFRPGDVIDGEVIKKATRTLPDLTALMKLVPHPTTGKPLIAANKKPFKTYKAMEEYLLKEGIEDPTYYRMFAREGAAIPQEALNGSTFKVVLNKPKPFNATPAVVVDNTVPRVVAGQLELPGALPGVKLDTSVKVSYDPSVIRPVAAANKVQDFRGALNKQRNALRKQLDDVDSPEEMEKILERISEIDDELATPDLKANPQHLKQLQDEVIPDNQHGMSQEVINLTESKFTLEQEMADLSNEARRLELELAQQEELLEQAANKVIENTADIGRRELDDDYIPKLPANGVTDQFFIAPDDIVKVNHSNGTMYTSIKDEEFFRQNASIVMRALDQVDIPGGVDVVYLTKNMVADMQAEDLRRLVNFIGDVNNAAFYDNKTKKLFIRDALFDPEMDAAEATRIIVHELGHRLHFRNSDGVKALRQQQRDAILKDGKPVSRYVESVKDSVAVKIDEDFAESVSFYRQQPYKFAEQFPARARVVAEQIEAAQAEALNSKTFYHGTRTPNWEPIEDPLTTQPREVWGQGTYLYSDVARAADDAQAELPVNTPGLVLKDVDMAGTVYEVKPNFDKVLRATDKVTPATQRIFADAIEDVIGRKTPETRKAIKHFVQVTSPKLLEDGTTKYPRQTVKELYGVMEKYVHKYLGQDGVTLPEETLSDLYRAVNLKMRDAGYDAIFDNELVVVLKPQKVTAINKEVLGETDTLDVLVSRFNVDSQLAKQNPASPSAQVNMMESGVRLQKEMVEQTRTKFETAKREQLRKVYEYQQVTDKLEAAAKREQEAKRLSNIREGKVAENALNERLGKQNTDPCSF